MEINSIFQEVLLSRGEGNLKLTPEQNDALQTIVLNDQDCLIVLPTSYTTLHRFIKVTRRFTMLSRAVATRALLRVLIISAV